MEGLGRKLRIAGALCLLAAVLYGVSGLRGTPGPAAVSSAPPVTPAPVIDLDRLYDLDYLVLEGDPERLELGLAGPVSAGPPRRGAVPEPAAGALWILGFIALYALYLPARSW